MGISEVMPNLSVEVDFPITDAAALVFDDPTRGQLSTGEFGADNAFASVTSYVRQGEIVRGVSRFDGVYARAEAGTLALVLDNRDARFDPTNLDGPYVSVGTTQVKPNREVRVRIPTGIDTDSVLRLDGSVGTHMTTPDSAGLSITGDIDIRVRCSLDAWNAIGTNQTFVSKSNSFVVDSTFAWQLWTTTTGGVGYLYLDWAETGGTVREVTSSVAVPFADGDLGWIRVTLDVNNGAGGHTVTFYTSTDDTNDHTAVSWTQLGTTQNAGAFTTSIADTTGLVAVGTTGGQYRAAGNFYEVLILSGIGGTAKGNPDLTAWTPDDTSITDAAGNTWTLNGNARFVGGGEVFHELYRGFVQAWVPEYPGVGKDAIVNLSAIDGTSVFAAYDGAEQAAAGAHEDSGARIGRIADNVGWSSSLRSIDTGIGTCQATTLAQNAWSEVLLTADSELGEVYFDGAGKLVFRNRHALGQDARSSASQAVFGDAGTELPYSGIRVTSDALQVRNLALITRVGGTQQTATDSASVAEYRTRTFTRSDFIFESDTVSQDYADFVIAVFKDADVRFDSITFLPLRDPVNLMPQVFERDLGDRITIRLRPLGRTDVIEKDCFIRGIRHTWDAGNWETQWALQDATKIGSVFVFDSQVSGLLDTGLLGF